ncbi:MAG: hypothetical protein ABIL06_24495, partial [Pseudomonadota bacterium]
IRKKILTSSGTVHHMMPGIRVVYSQGPRHDGKIPEFTTKVNRRFDPKSWFPKYGKGEAKKLWPGRIYRTKKPHFRAVYGVYAGSANLGQQKRGYGCTVTP